MLREFSESLSGEILSYFQKQEELFSRGTFSYPCSQPSASALRKVLRTHLPGEYQVGRGHIISKDDCSPIQEVIIYDRESIPVFEEGDLVFLSPNQAKVVIGIHGKEASEHTIQKVIHATAKVGEMMKQAGRAQGLVAQWLARTSAVPATVGFGHWTKAIANRNIPAFFAWGNTHCFCRHINCEPAFFTWAGKNGISPSYSPALTSLLSLIWYHLLQHKKSSPFKEWFAEDEWREEKGSFDLSHMRGGDVLVPVLENAELTAQLGADRASSSAVAIAKAKTAPSNGRRKKQRTRSRKRTPNSAGARQRAKENLQLQQQVNDHSNTPVHLAVLSLDGSALNRCVEQELDLDSKNKEGNTSLHLAAQYDLIEMAETLVDGGADLNSRNFVYDTPLHVAIKNDNNRVIRELLEAGAEVEARNNRARTPLHQAAICGNREAVLLLLEYFADIHARMEKDMLPLHLACWYGQGEIVDLLIEKGANMNAVNSDGNTALHFAAFNGQVKVIKQLINYHADTSIPNHAGETYLQGINEGYSGEVIRVLE